MPRTSDCIDWETYRTLRNDEEIKRLEVITGDYAEWDLDELNDELDNPNDPEPVWFDYFEGTY